jgi:hypothetical protein
MPNKVPMGYFYDYTPQARVSEPKFLNSNIAIMHEAKASNESNFLRKEGEDFFRLSPTVGSKGSKHSSPRSEPEIGSGTGPETSNILQNQLEIAENIPSTPRLLFPQTLPLIPSKHLLGQPPKKNLKKLPTPNPDPTSNPPSTPQNPMDPHPTPTPLIQKLAPDNPKPNNDEATVSKSQRSVNSISAGPLDDTEPLEAIDALEALDAVEGGCGNEGGWGEGQGRELGLENPSFFLD